MNKPTVEEMVEELNIIMWERDNENKRTLNDRRYKMLEAIRKHLTESDLAHWMDRCHELEMELAELTKKLSEVKFDVKNPSVQDCDTHYVQSASDKEATDE